MPCLPQGLDGGPQHKIQQVKQTEPELFLGAHKLLSGRDHKPNHKIKLTNLKIKIIFNIISNSQDIELETNAGRNF